MKISRYKLNSWIVTATFLVFSLTSQAQFQREFGTALDESFTKVIRSGTNFFVLGRSQPTANTTNRATVVRINSSGILQWTVSLNIASEWNDAVVTPTGELMVVGSTLPKDATCKSLMGLITAAGTISWMKSYDSPGLDVFTRIVRTPIAQTFPYYVCGTQNDPTASATTDDVILLNLNAAGTINWKKKFVSTVDDEFARDMEVMPNGDLVLVGNFGSNGIILRTDNAGIVVNGGTPINLPIAYTDITVRSGGGFYAVGGTLSNFTPYLIRYDNDLIAQWHVSITGLRAISGVWEDPATARIYVTGTGLFNGKSRAVLIRFVGTASPSIEWVKFLDNNEISYTDGSFWFMSPNQIAFTDGRLPLSGGFGGVCAFVSLSDMVLTSCMTKTTSLSIKSESFDYNGPDIATTFFDVPQGTNITGSALMWKDQDACAIPCIAGFSFQGIGTCGNTQFTNSSTGQPTLTYSWNFGDPTTGNSNVSGALNPTHQFSHCGTFKVCLKVTGSGCVDSTCQNVSYIDNIKPLITCPVNLTLQCNSSTNPPATGSASATDNCGVVGTTFSDVVSGLMPCDASIIRTWRTTDACDNASSCVQTIVVRDNIAPSITCPQNVSLACNTNTNTSTTGVATSSDNCTATNAIIISNSDVNTGTLPCNATINRTWQAKDACSNISTCVQTIAIRDNITPIITCPQSLTLACNTNTNPPASGVATATDNCTVTSHILITNTDVTTGTLPCNGTITRTWQAKDDCNNIATCIQTISIKDNVAPIITCPQNISLACNTNTNPPSSGVATATDNCTVTSHILITNTDVTSGTMPCNATIARTWQAKDECNNVSSCLQTITIKDTIAPSIKCPQNGTVNVIQGFCFYTGAVPQPTAIDNCDPILDFTCSLLTSGSSILISSQTQYPKGINNITCFARDDCGNQSTNCNFTLTVVDNIPPSIQCPQSVTVVGGITSQGLCKAIVNNLAPIVSDNCPMLDVTYTLSGATTGQGITDASGTNFMQGVTTVNYTVTDMAGNPKSCSFTVSVNCTKQTIEPCCPDFEIHNQNGMGENCCMLCKNDSIVHARSPLGTPGKMCDVLVVCKNSTSNLIVYPNLSSPFIYQWTINGGTPGTTTGNPVSIHWGSGPKGSVTVVITDGSGCTKTITRDVCFLDSPIADFIYSPFTNICTGTNISFTNTSTGGNIYTWFFGDGTSSQLVNPQHQYGSPGTYTVTLVAANASGNIDINCGCVDTFSQIITVGTGPGIVPGCKEMICPGDTTEYCSSTVSCSSFSWSIIGGTIIGSSNLSCVTVVWNSYPASLTLATTGCGACNLNTIIPNVIWPSIPIIGPIVVCVGSTNTYSLPVMPGTFYSWSVSPGATISNNGAYPSTYPINNPSVNVNFPNAGTYNLISNYYNQNKKNPCGGRDTIKIRVLPNFNVTGDLSLCQDSTSAELYFANGNADWTITPTTGWSSSTLNSAGAISVKWLLPGTYVMTSVPNPSSPFCNPSGVTLTITVKPSPILTFVSPIKQVCTNSLTNYTVTSNLTGNITWSFTTGAGTISPFGTNNSSASVQFTIPGPWDLQAKQTSEDSCKGMTTIHIIAMPPPPPINPISNICSGGTVIASVNGPLPPGGYVWSSTPGAVLTGGQGTTSATFIINSNATISVSNCSGTNTINVSTITATVTITKVSTSCGATLTASSGAQTYDWFLNGSFLVSGNPINITQNGTYLVVATYSNKCIANATIIVTGLDPVTTTITAIGNLCNGGSVTLQASVSANCASSLYVWGSSNSGFLTTTGSTLIVNAPGSYWVTVSCANGCMDISNIVIIQPCGGIGPGVPCIPDLVISSSRCKNPVSLSTNIPVGCTPIGTIWYYGDGTSGITGNHQYTNVGIYSVIAVMTCADSTMHCGTQLDTVPMVDSFTYVITCDSPNGYQVLLQDASTVIPSYLGYTLNWTTNTPCATLSSSNSPTPTLTVPLGCNPTVTLTISKNGCTLLDSFSFNFPTTSFSINGELTPCKNEDYVYSTAYTAGVISYLWNFGDGTYGVTNPIKHQFNGIPANPTVSLTITDTWGCMFITTLPITVISPPPLKINPSPSVFVCPTCPPIKALSVTTPLLFIGYQWYQNGDSIPGATNPTYDLCPNTDPGNYYVTALSLPDSCLVISDTVIVLQYPLPIADIQPRTIQCVPSFPYTTILIHNSKADPNYTYDWYLNNTNGPPIFSSSTSNYLTYKILSDSCFVFIIKVTDIVTHCTAFDTACICFSQTPIVTILPGGNFCEGNPITFTATASPPPASNYTYIWQDGTQGQTYTTSFAGTYSVTATSKVGCSTSSGPREISPLPYLELFPQGCDTLCDTAHLYFPIPLHSSGWPNYTITWYDSTNTGTSIIGTGFSIPINSLGLGVNHNIFCIVNSIFGCPDTTGELNLFIKHCGECNCDSTSFNFLYAISKQVLKPVHCGDTLLAPPASSGLAVNLYSFFHCIGADCDSTTFVEWTLIKPDSSSFQNIATTDSSGSFVNPINASLFSGTGIYTLQMTGHCGQDSCPCTIYFNQADSICGCKGSTFGDILLTQISRSSFDSTRNAQPVKLICSDDKAYLLNCNSTYFINTSFFCKDTACPSNVTYQLIPPKGNLINGTVGFSFTPNQSGTYSLTLYGWCGDKICDSCKISFVTNCPAADTCTCDSTSFDFLYAISRQVLKPVNCGDTLFAPHSSAGLAVNLYSSFHCIPTDCDSSTFVGMTLTKPDHSISYFNMQTLLNGSFANPINAALFNQIGIYSLHMVGHCGKDSCLCTIYFNQTDSCCQSYDLFCDKLMHAVNITLDSVHCKATLNIGSLTPCDSIVQVNWGDNQFSTGHIGSGGMAMHSYAQSGTYIISWSAIEYNYSTSPPTICYEKRFRDTVMVKCCDTCSCGTFDFLYAVSRGPLAFKHCGDTLAVPPVSSGLPVIFIGSFQCMGTNCTNDSIAWTLTGPSSFVAMSGKVLPGPLFFIANITSSTFSFVGLYTLTFTAHCGSTSCPPCKIYFYQPENCCQNYDLFCDKIMNAVSISVAKNLCKATLNIGSLSPCDSVVKIKWGDSKGSLVHIGSGGMSMHTYTSSGTYIISWLAIEYDNAIPPNICYEKEFVDTIVINCCDSCINNLIKNPVFSDGASGQDVTVQPLKPNLKFREINMMVRPNPTTDKIIVSISTTLEDSKNIIRLISIEGKVLRSIVVAGWETPINMEDYASGLYFISLHDAHGKMLALPAKIIKQ